MTPSRWKLAFFGLAGVNVAFLVALSVSIMCGSWRLPLAGLNAARLPLMAAGRHLPNAEKQAWTTLIHQRTLEAAPHLAEARRLRQSVLASMKRPDFDPKSGKLALEQAQRAEWTGRALIENAVVDYVGRLSADQRPMLVKGLVGARWRSASLRGQTRPWAANPASQNGDR